MSLNNLYNFKNTIRHFINIDNLFYPADISSFDTDDLCWTIPLSYRIKKDSDKYRTIKIPNVLNFVRAIIVTYQTLTISTTWIHSTKDSL